jgi:hypothetical protein
MVISSPAEVASDATGDSISVAGIFEAKGAVAKTMLGMTIGSFAGEAVGGDIGDSVGSVLGAAGGIAASARAGIYRFCVAVSPTKVYVLVPTGGRTPGGQAHEIRKGELEVVQTFDRATLEVTAKARVTVRILILEDLKTGARVEFEGSRIGWSHSKEVVKTLVASDHEDG